MSLGRYVIRFRYDIGVKLIYLKMFTHTNFHKNNNKRYFRQKENKNIFFECYMLMWLGVAWDYIK